MNSTAVPIRPTNGVSQTKTHRATVVMTTRRNPRRSGKSGGAFSRRRAASTISSTEMTTPDAATQNGPKAEPGAKSDQYGRCRVARNVTADNTSMTSAQTISTSFMSLPPRSAAESLYFAASLASPRSFNTTRCWLCISAKWALALLAGTTSLRRNISFMAAFHASVATSF